MELKEHGYDVSELNEEQKLQIKAIEWDDITEWGKFAYCLGVETDIFYSLKEEEQRKVAVEVCGKCAVKELCLLFAVNTEEIHGVWGGSTEKQRAPLIRKKKRFAYKWT